MSTSALRSSPTLLGAHNPPKLSSEPLSERMRSLVPIVAAIAVAALWIPHFITGFWVGPRILLTSIVISVAMRALGLAKKDLEGTYLEDIKKMPFTASIIGPVFGRGGISRGFAPSSDSGCFEAMAVDGRRVFGDGAECS